MQFGTTGGLAGALGNFGGGFVGVGLISGNGIFWNTKAIRLPRPQLVEG